MKLEQIIPELPDRQVIAFYSYKGGVGRTMALANVAACLSSQHAAREQNEVEILCIDLDLEAPGLPAFLAPEPGRGEVRGFLGLLLDLWQTEPEEEALTQLENALSADGPYMYPVAGASNLWVLPVGDLDADERWRALDALHRSLAATKEVTEPDEVVARAPFFRRLRQVVRRRFTYILIDSRTGLADEAFATTVLLADAMALFFRPNTTQLLGVQDVFTRFLYQRGLKATDDDLPVIPVLSPQPTYTDPRLKEVRRHATEHVFKWLASSEAAGGSPRDHYAPPAQRLIELPFDATFEIGENLLVPVSPEETVEDPEAPLYRAYIELVTRLQKHNARHDILGVEWIEAEHYLANRPRQAFKYLLAQIAQEPENADLWLNVSLRYSDVLAEDRELQARFWHFCEAISELPERRPVPAFFSDLWLSYFFARDAPDLCRQRMRRAWSTALESRLPVLLDNGLVGIVEYYRADGSASAPEGLPSHKAASEALAYERLQQDKLRNVAEEVIEGLVTVYIKASAGGNERLVEALEDLLQLSPEPTRRAILLGYLGKYWQLMTSFGPAWAAYRAGTALREASGEIGEEYIQLVLSLADRAAGDQAIANTMQPVLQPRWQIIQDIRYRAPVEEVKRRLSALKKYNASLAKNPTLLVYALLYEERFEEAALHLEGGGEDYDLGLPGLSRWLAHSAPLSHELAATSRSDMKKDPGAESVIRDSAAPTLLATAPTELSTLAREKLAAGCWPLHFAGWALLACTSPEGSAEYRPRLGAQLGGTPLLARYLRRNENFPLLRFVWQKHFRDHTIDETTYEVFCQALDLVESWPVDEELEVEPYEPPPPILDDDDPRLGEMIDRWLGHLAPILEHPVLGDVVRTIVEAGEEAGASPGLSAS